MVDNADTYERAKLRQLDEQATLRVYGHALDFNLGDAARRWKPVSPCLCVHDSPDNPCPCPPFVWWLRSDMIVAEGDADRKDHRGSELRYFDVLVESKILVESVQSVSAGALKGLGSNISARTISSIADRSEGDRQGSGSDIVFMGPAAGFAAGVAAGVLGNMIWGALQGMDKEVNWTPELVQELCKQAPWLDMCR